ncbi:MAG TPA: hypothetical protein VIM86_12135, partial [Thermodesulfobacteriota bacterium]
MPLAACRRPVVVILALLLAALTVTPLAAEPVPGAARAVWLGTSAGLVGLDAADATVLLEVAEPDGVAAVAPDERRGVV